MPGSKSKHTAKWDRCVKKVEDKSPNANPYAICSASIDDAGLKKSHQKRSKDSYYANRKKAARKESKKEGMITNFTEFVNEHHYGEYSEEEGARINQEKENDEWYKVKELVDKFILRYPTPNDMDVEDEEQQLGDYLIDFLEDERVDIKSYLGPVADELVKLGYDEPFRQW